MSRSMQIGAQLYTLREYTKTRDDLEKTFEKLAAMGFRSVQISALGPIPVDEVAETLGNHGLTCAATHMGWNKFEEDLDAVIATHKAWGCVHTAIGGAPQDRYLVQDGWKAFAGDLAPIAEKLAAEGMDFSYHNHDWEFRHFDGKPWLEHLYATCPPEHLKAELDLHWVTRGGGDPAAWVRKLGNRQPVVHVKDFVVSEKREPQFAPVGHGNMNWDAILPACEEVGVETLLIEQDDCYGEDPFACLEKSYRFLRDCGHG
ncbi:MAG: sugar phosphate isomerase/epimerase family protein [Opitutales bacterium]